MKSYKYLQDLFDKIKDDIEFDSDVIALEILLNKMFIIMEAKCYENYIYILKKYDLNNLKIDIDFTPLTKSFAQKLIFNKGLIKYLNITNDLEFSKKAFIYSELFNLYHEDCILYTLMEEYIKHNNLKKIKTIINIVIKLEKYIKQVFDKTEFLKKVIIIYLKNGYTGKKFLNETINFLSSPKERAILKALLINENIYL